MAETLKTPPPRNLDIYRLVVARGLKQADVALLFSVTPVRMFQIVSRVRRWVDRTIGDWLFPRRDDLRFYAALEMAQIRVHELQQEPQNVLFVGPEWTYNREVNRASESRASQDPNQIASLSADPLKSLPKPAASKIALSPSAVGEFDDPQIHALALRLAELLILWKKSQPLGNALKSPSRSTRS